MRLGLLGSVLEVFVSIGHALSQALKQHRSCLYGRGLRKVEGIRQVFDAETEKLHTSSSALGHRSHNGMTAAAITVVNNARTCSDISLLISRPSASVICFVPKEIFSPEAQNPSRSKGRSPLRPESLEKRCSAVWQAIMVSL